MSNKYTRYLNNDPTGPKGQLASFQHATDVFVENFYRLSPRFKFLFYAYFELNPTIPQLQSLLQNRNEYEIPLLVKTASLPSFNYDTVTKNRYNRKKVVYKQMTTDPITFAFHDDNAGIMNALWYAHNEYYSNDVLHSNSNDWLPDNKSWTAKKYGMDTITNTRFFKRITLYTMSRQKFNSYTLWGPKIKNWKHGDLSYSEGSGTIENSMTVEYESVSYSSGDVTETSVDGDGKPVELTPDGFASVHYDSVMSPLNTGDNGNSDTVFGSVPETNYFSQKPDVNSTLIQAQQENRAIPLPTNTLPSTASVSSLSPNLIGGIIGVLFPSTASSSDTVATPKTFSSTFDSAGTSPLFSGTTNKAPTINDV